MKMTKEERKKFFEDRHLTLAISKDVDTYHKFFHVFNFLVLKTADTGSKRIAEGSVLTRVSSSDMAFPISPDNLTCLARTRAEKAAIRLLQNKPIHDPLAQGHLRRS